MRGSSRGKVPTGRKTHDSDPSGINVPFRSILSYQLYRPLRILQRSNGFIDHNSVVRQTILQYKGCNAPVVEYFGYIRAFMSDRKTHITTARANNDCGFLRIWVCRGVHSQCRHRHFAYPGHVIRCNAFFPIGRRSAVRNFFI